MVCQQQDAVNMAACSRHYGTNVSLSFLAQSIIIPSFLPAFSNIYFKDYTGSFPTIYTVIWMLTALNYHRVLTDMDLIRTRDEHGRRATAILV